MRAFRFHRRVEDGAIRISGLDVREGQDVEVILIVESDAARPQDSKARKGQPRRPGSAKGQIRISDDFHAPLPGGWGEALPDAEEEQ